MEKKLSATDHEGKILDENKLTDTQLLLLDKVRDIDLSILKEHGGCYFVWGCLPEAQKMIIKSHVGTYTEWQALLESMNQMLNMVSKGKLELVVREKE